MDSQKIAEKINKECLKINRERPLNVLIEVLTSDEGTKSGIEIGEVINLARFIQSECPKL